jgi:hypothetical protein
MVKRGTKVIIFLGFLILLIVPLVSAGFFSDFRARITGELSSRPTDVNVSVTGVNPVTINVFNITLNGSVTDPSEDSVSNIEFWVTVTDADGVNDINDSSVNATFSRTGEPTRTNSSCVLVGDNPPNSANFSCTIGMYYFYEIGLWNITVFGNDLGNKTAQSNTSQIFQYNELIAIKISPSALTFPSVSPGDINQTSNEPTLINNTGNYNVTLDNVQVNAIDLQGVDISDDFIFAANFSASIFTGSTAECNSTAIVLVNATDTFINDSILTRGNHSLGGGVGQEQIYYCIQGVPSDISSQTYSTLGLGSWNIKIV